MSNHVIIAFEGLDCSFKETNYISFVNHLKQMREEPGFKIHTEAFPRYGNPYCKPAEAWLNGHFDRNVLNNLPEARNSFYAIDRFDYWYGLKEDNTRNIDFIRDNESFHYFIFDRYNLSNTIYNPIYSGINIRDFCYDKTKYNIPQPNIIVWMRMGSFDTLLNLLSKKRK